MNSYKRVLGALYSNALDLYFLLKRYIPLQYLLTFFDGVDILPHQDFRINSTGNKKPLLTKNMK